MSKSQPLLSEANWLLPKRACGPGQGVSGHLCRLGGCRREQHSDLQVSQRIRACRYVLHSGPQQMGSGCLCWCRREWGSGGLPRNTWCPLSSPLALAKAPRRSPISCSWSLPWSPEQLQDRIWDPPELLAFSGASMGDPHPAQEG